MGGTSSKKDAASGRNGLIANKTSVSNLLTNSGKFLGVFSLLTREIYP